MTKPVNSMSPHGFWIGLSPLRADSLNCSSKLNLPSQYRLVYSDSTKWDSILSLCKSLTDSVQIELPNLEGAFYSATIARSASVPLEWESKFGIRAFAGQTDSVPGHLVRMEVDSAGMRVMYSGDGKSIFINRICKEFNSMYIIFNKDNLPKGAKSIFE